MIYSKNHAFFLKHWFILKIHYDLQFGKPNFTTFWGRFENFENFARRKVEHFLKLCIASLLFYQFFFFYQFFLFHQFCHCSIFVKTHFKFYYPQQGNEAERYVRPRREFNDGSSMWNFVTESSSSDIDSILKFNRILMSHVVILCRPKWQQLLHVIELYANFA